MNAHINFSSDPSSLISQTRYKARLHASSSLSLSFVNTNECTLYISSRPCLWGLLRQLARLVLISVDLVTLCMLK